MISVEERLLGEPSEETVAAVVKGADPAADDGSTPSFLTRAIELIRRSNDRDTDTRELWLTSTSCKLVEDDRVVAACSLDEVRALPVQPASETDERHVLRVVTDAGEALAIEGQQEDLTRFAAEVCTLMASRHDVEIDLRDAAQQPEVSSQGVSEVLTKD